MADLLIHKVLNNLKEFKEFGNPRTNRIAFSDFRENKVQNLNAVFFLSTGRTGTKFFSNLLNRSSEIYAVHEPFPEFTYTNKYAYQYYKKEGFDDEDLNGLFSSIFLTARDQLLHKIYMHDKIYLETNNWLTFFAPALKYLFPKAKFVFLYRHPGDVIRSAMNRKWYMGNTFDLGRLAPLEDDISKNKWEKMDSLSKNAWLWNETNQFIINYLNTLEKEDYFYFNFNKLTTSNVSSLSKFLNIELPEEKVKKKIGKPINQQKLKTHKSYSNWKEEDKDIVRYYCSVLSQELGYQL